MDWQTLRAGISNDSDYPARTNRLTALMAVMDGRQYDHILNDFWNERDAGGRYIKLQDRRPSVRTNLCRITIDELASLLFSDNRFPRVVKAGDAKLSDRLQAMVREAGLEVIMQEAVVRGATGSAALAVQFMSDKVFVEVLDTAYITPRFKPDDPDTLLSATQEWKACGRDLVGMPGVGEVELGTQYWYRREWSVDREIVYAPQTVADWREGKNPAVASEITHALGFVPVVWIKNLPGGRGCDGASTFEAAIDTVIELDYLESQANRAMRYAGDPKLVIKGRMDGSELTASGSDAIQIEDPNGDAKLLELEGGASEAYEKRSRTLRRTALEAIHGNLADPERMNAATSGRAMELLHQRQIWLAGLLRLPYGKALLRVITMIGEAIGTYTVLVDDEPMERFNGKGLHLDWGAWFDPTYGDMVSLAAALQNFVSGGVICEETATKFIATVFRIVDVDDERKRVDEDRAAADARAMAQKAAVQAVVKEPS